MHCLKESMNPPPAPHPPMKGAKYKVDQDP